MRTLWRKITEAWKAVLAFLGPGLVLIGEQVLFDGTVTWETVKRSLVAGLATSLLVYVKRNAASPNPSTSTPGPGLPQDGARASPDELIEVAEYQPEPERPTPRHRRPPRR